MTKTKKTKQSQRPRQEGRMVMGKNCIQEILDHAPERLIKVFTSKQDKGKPDALLENLQAKNIPIQMVDKDKLTSMVESDSHQSFVAQVKNTGTTDLATFLRKSSSKKKSLVLALDCIFDPQNLGALLRAADCFGVDAVLWSKNRGTDVTPVVSKASVGASELIEVIKVSNLVEAMKKFQDADYWTVTAEVDETSQNLYSFDFPDKTLLVMGSEGKGVQKLVSKNADFKVYISMLGKINSLNVSQATSVFLSHWRSQVETLENIPGGH